MSITAPPTIPQITDPATFAPRAQAWVVWQAEELYPFIIDASQTLGLSTNSTSTTSNTIGTGAKTFTVQTGKGYVAGQSLSIARTSAPTNRMFAVVTSYNSGTGELIVNVQAIEGSGTFTDWSIALAFNGIVSLAQLEKTGTAGQVLTSNGTGLDPSYQDIPKATEADYITGTDNTKFLTPQVARNQNIVLGTAKAANTGTAINFTSEVNTWSKVQEIIFDNVSLTGTDNLLVQIGDSGGYETTGYSADSTATGGGVSITINSTSGFIISAAAAVAAVGGTLTIYETSNNRYIATFVGRRGDGATIHATGIKQLDSKITSIRVVATGANIFDGSGLLTLSQH